MSITLQCIHCHADCVTLHQSQGGIIPWVAICEECWATCALILRMAYKLEKKISA